MTAGGLNYGSSSWINRDMAQRKLKQTASGQGYLLNLLKLACWHWTAYFYMKRPSVNCPSFSRQLCTRSAPAEAWHSSVQDLAPDALSRWVSSDDLTRPPEQIHCHVCVACGLKGKKNLMRSWLGLDSAFVCSRLLKGKLMNIATIVGKSPLTLTVNFPFASPRMSHHVRYWCFCKVLFPRASGRRVLPIVGVCKTSSHLQIFLSSHLLIFTSSHLHIFSSSHLHIFASSHPHIFTSSHLHIFSPSHLLIFIFSSSHLLIFTSSHPHILTSSHPHIFTFSHLHINICSSSHLLIFTSSHLHICSSSHLLIFTPSHLHTLTSSHLLVFTSSHSLLPSLALLPSCSLVLFYFSLEGAGQCQRDGTKRNPFARNELRSPNTNVKLRFLASNRNRFARNEVRSTKTEVKMRFASCPANSFARNEVRSSKNYVKLRFLWRPIATLSRTKWSSIAKNWCKIAITLVQSHNRFARNEVRSPKNEVKLQFLLSNRNPFARNEVWSPKTEVKLRFHGSGLCV